jgi:DNA-binding XRE family transcriptional regulator
VLGGRDPSFAAWGRSQRATVIGFVATSLILSFLIGSQRRTLARARAAETALKRSCGELEQANRDLEAFAYSASHDLQEPLRTIGTSAEMLRRKWGEQMRDEESTLVARILGASTRMRTLIEDLLAYTRAVKPEDSPPPKIDSGRVLVDVLEGLRASIHEAQGTVETMELPTIAFHESHLAQVFQNLISNAIRYRGPEPPRVCVKAYLRDGWWVFSVSQEEFAAKAHVHRTFAGSLERGEKNCSFHALVLIARCFGLTLSEMLIGLEFGEPSASNIAGRQGLATIDSGDIDRQSVLQEALALERTARTLKKIALAQKNSSAPSSQQRKQRSRKLRSRT